MASNALSFEQIKEMQRQNKFKRKTKREEISKSAEYRNTKTVLTEKQNQVSASISTHYAANILTVSATTDPIAKSQIKGRKERAGSRRTAAQTRKRIARGNSRFSHCFD